MSDPFCLTHGFTLEYDFKSDLTVCPECERQKAQK